MSPGAPLLCDINTQHGQRQTHVVTTSVNDEMVEAASDFINKWEDDGKTRDNKKWWLVGWLGKPARPHLSNV
ncbi:hypothetical protein F2P81_025844 [Scophthalmus maximus]|uniref:Uncharacterized protein n=1 Tax=Scophthalmus maximus TaxID=52904 RepID=A0A6A4RJ45_SCOMX|nr:hypothetical protein F2P81_025844 [Scophthalmus maximus]